MFEVVIRELVGELGPRYVNEEYGCYATLAEAESVLSALTAQGYDARIKTVKLSSDQQARSKLLESFGVKYVRKDVESNANWVSGNNHNNNC